jgi:uncharacterized membrane protein
MRARPALLYPLALAYFGFGVVHLSTPDSLMPLMPAWVPFPCQVILVTGACEIAGAVGLAIPRLRAAAAVMLALYALCVWPANIHHALSGAHVGGIPDSWWYHGPRLALQPVIIWLPLFAVGLVRWPFNSRSGPILS